MANYVVHTSPTSPPFHITIKHMGHLHLMLGLTLVGVGTCNVVYGCDQLPTALHATGIWVGIIVAAVGVIAVSFVSRKPSTTLVKVFLALTVACGLLALLTSSLSVVSLSDLSYYNGYNSAAAGPEPYVMVLPAGKTEATSPPTREEIRRGQIIDGVQLGVATLLLITCVSAFHVTRRALQLSENHGGGNPATIDHRQTVMATTTSSGRVQIAPHVSVAEYFENGFHHGHKSGGISPSIYDDFPDFDHFRNNIEEQD